jgi:hypothetical protein
MELLGFIPDHGSRGDQTQARVRWHLDIDPWVVADLASQYQEGRAGGQQAGAGHQQPAVWTTNLATVLMGVAMYSVYGCCQSTAANNVLNDASIRAA